MRNKIKQIIFCIFISFTIYQYALSDDIKFTKIDDNLIGLTSNDISSLAIDKNGHLWVGARNQMIEYDGEKWIEHSEIFNDIDYLKNPISGGRCLPSFGGSFYPSEIKIDNNNHVWMSSGFGLIEYNRNKWILYNLEFNGRTWLTSPSCFTFDEKGRIWMAYFDTINIIEEGKCKKYFSVFTEGTQQAIPASLILECFDIAYQKTPQECLLLASTWGVLEFNINTKRIYNRTPNEKEQPFFVYSIEPGLDKYNLFTTSEGILEMKMLQYNSEWTSYMTSDINFSDGNFDRKQILKVFLDPNGQEWLITRLNLIGSLYKLNGKEAELVFSLKDVSTKTKSYQINDVLITDDNTMYIATNNGLYISE